MGLTYRLTAYGKSRRNLPGVPWRDLSAEEFETACAANPGMEERGYFERVEEEANSIPAPRLARSRTTDVDAPLTAEENPND